MGKALTIVAILTAMSSSQTEANARLPYAQALAICKGRAAQAMVGGIGPIIRPGIISGLALAAQENSRQTDIMNGCLAEYGWIVQ